MAFGPRQASASMAEALAKARPHRNEKKMDEQAVRAIVRQVLARHSGASGEPEPVRFLAPSAHVSHFRYALPPSEGPCLIEPSVQCNHCGYCESHGH